MESVQHPVGVGSNYKKISMKNYLPMRHSKAIRHYMDNVLVAGKGIRFHIDFEECMDKVFGMESLQHPVGIESIDVEAAQHLPASKVIDDFKQRLFLVTFHESFNETRSFFKQPP